MLVLLVGAANHRGWLNPPAVPVLLTSIAGAALVLLLVIMYLWRRGEFPMTQRYPHPAESTLLLTTCMAVFFLLGAIALLVTTFRAYIPKMRTEPVHSTGSLICAMGMCIAVIWVCRFMVRSARKQCQEFKRRPT